MRERWLARLFPEEVADQILGERPQTDAVERIPWGEAAVAAAVREGALEDGLDIERALVLRETVQRAPTTRVAERLRALIAARAAGATASEAPYRRLLR